MKLVAGLGNPGSAYAHTRHNAGYMVADNLAAKHRVRLFLPRFRSRVAACRICGQKAVILKPRTYMNLSGKAIAPALRHYGLSPADLVVIHDELDLPLGTIRFARKGGDGGHRGLRSIIESLGTENFIRLRFGIGRPPGDTDPADYVLSTPDEDEKELFESTVALAGQALYVMLTRGLDEAMNSFHGSG